MKMLSDERLTELLKRAYDAGCENGARYHYTEFFKADRDDVCTELTRISSDDKAQPFHATGKRVGDECNNVGDALAVTVA